MQGCAVEEIQRTCVYQEDAGRVSSDRKWPSDLDKVKP